MAIFNGAGKEKASTVGKARSLGDCFDAPWSYVLVLG